MRQNTYKNRCLVGFCRVVLAERYQMTRCVNMYLILGIWPTKFEKNHVSLMVYKVETYFMSSGYRPDVEIWDVSNL